MTASVNFAFLAPHDPALAELAAAAESLFSAHPRQCVATLRTLAEALARQTAAFTGLYKLSIGGSDAPRRFRPRSSVGRPP